MPIVEDCGDHRYFVKCKCGIEQSRLYWQKCDAARHWNRRKDAPIDKDINVRSKDEPQAWTKENCKGCRYNEYPYDSGTCFVRVCINGNKYEPKDEPQADCQWK